MSPEDTARFWSHVDRTGECWEWTYTKNSKGYGMFWLDGRYRRANRIALLVDGVEVEPSDLACHHCDTPACVRPSHLYVGTHQDNMRDRAIRGRTARAERMPHERAKGSGHGNAKLTEQQVREIRQRYVPGMGGQLRKEYGVSQATFSGIVNRKTWRHVA